MRMSRRAVMSCHETNEAHGFSFCKISHKDCIQESVTKISELRMHKSSTVLLAIAECEREKSALHAMFIIKREFKKRIFPARQNKSYGHHVACHSIDHQRKFRCLSHARRAKAYRSNINKMAAYSSSLRALQIHFP